MFPYVKVDPNRADNSDMFRRYVDMEYITLCGGISIPARIIAYDDNKHWEFFIAENVLKQWCESFLWPWPDKFISVHWQ